MKSIPQDMKEEILHYPLNKTPDYSYNCYNRRKYLILPKSIR
jgi:hypothetical protein